MNFKIKAPITIPSAVVISAPIAVPTTISIEAPITLGVKGDKGDKGDTGDAQVGGMLAADYDPLSIESDVFDLSNHYGIIESESVTIDGGLL